MLRKFLVLFSVVSFFSFAQDKAITLEEIWNGTFSTENMEVLHSMNNGQTFLKINM